MIKILQIGLGPLGVKIHNYIADRDGLQTVAAVDKNPALIGRDMAEHCGYDAASGVTICGSVSEAIAKERPDVAVLSTVSDLERIAGQVEEIVAHQIPIVSTCEELSYPWDCGPEISARLDQLAKDKGVAVVGTGVNPGFLMDSLPTFLTAVSKDVNTIQVNRIQDAQYRRIPFQQKIGAGLSLAQFEQKKQAGTLRHVGLTESMQLIANRMGWQLEKTEDIIEPVVADQDITTSAMTVKKGDALGVMQTGRAYVNGEVKIELLFKAAVGLPESYDEVSIKGTPDITSRVSGGVNGDIATCAIVINTIPQILRATPGLKTMADIPLVSYYSKG